MELEEYFPIIIAVLVLLITLLIVRKFTGGKAGSNVLLMGICGAGKTSLFSLLVHRTSKSTFTSSKPNFGTFFTKKKRALNVIDIPGHERICEKNFDSFKDKCAALIFVVDSKNIGREVKDVANILYRIIGDAKVRHAPLLIACNKQDTTLVKSAKAVQRLLEQELEMCRKTHEASLLNTDSSSDRPAPAVTLGQRGKAFTFDDLPNRVRFVECSATDISKIQPIFDWMNDL